MASPFNASRAARLRADADEEESYLSKITAMRLEMGRFLIDGAREFDMATTLEQRFELLNTNVADRAAVPAGAGLVDLLFVYCAEDSAAHRGDQWNDAPMGNAMRWAVLDGMANTPKGREASTKLFGELFAPGGLFYGAPTYYQHPDGTMLRQAPALVVHDAAGSRTIERRIGK
ncbi:MAG: hypothetical protein H7Z39_12210 [Burkholderiaceae bacterium]|nr:hypothetical protein [Burkholderiaceae bacterium]